MFTELERDAVLTIKSLVVKSYQNRIDRWAGIEGNRDLDTWIRANCHITGGVSASVFHNETVKDVDCYYNGTDMASFNNALKHLFIEKEGPYHHFVQSINPKYMVGEVEGKLITANAITLVGDIQIIRLNTVVESRQLFDYIHCQPVYEFSTNVYKISYAQFKSIEAKKLIANPGGKITAHRQEKFKARGWQ